MNNRLDITVDRSDFDAKTSNFVAAVSSMPNGMKKVADVLQTFILSTFRTATDPWGVPWPDLSPATIKNRQRRGEFSTKPLYDSGDMFKSIKPDSDATSASVSMGEGLPDPRATVNQFGNPDHRPWGAPVATGLPPRPSFPQRTPDEAAFPQEWLEAVLIPIQDEMNKAAANA